jgi:hypothetical protein
LKFAIGCGSSKKWKWKEQQSTVPQKRGDWQIDLAACVVENYFHFRG